jgi:hypothetical protein
MARRQKQTKFLLVLTFRWTSKTDSTGRSSSARTLLDNQKVRNVEEWRILLKIVALSSRSRLLNVPKEIKRCRMSLHPPLLK